MESIAYDVANNENSFEFTPAYFFLVREEVRVTKMKPRNGLVLSART